MQVKEFTPRIVGRRRDVRVTMMTGKTKPRRQAARCFCEGPSSDTPCPPCVVAWTVGLSRAHDDLSIPLLKKHVPNLDGLNAAYLIEAMRYVERRHY